MSYPDEWNHPPHAPVETHRSQAYREASQSLDVAWAVLHARGYLPEIVNKIKGLRDQIDVHRQTMLTPPAP